MRFLILTISLFAFLDCSKSVAPKPVPTTCTANNFAESSCPMGCLWDGNSCQPDDPSQCEELTDSTSCNVAVINQVPCYWAGSVCQSANQCRQVQSKTPCLQAKISGQTCAWNGKCISGSGPAQTCSAYSQSQCPAESDLVSGCYWTGSACAEATQCSQLTLQNACLVTKQTGVTCSWSGSQCYLNQPGICQPGQRPMTVHNDSSKDIWFGFTSGSIPCTIPGTQCQNFGNGKCIKNPSIPPLIGPGGHQIPQGVCGCNYSNAQDPCGSLASCNMSNGYCYWNPPEIHHSSNQVNNQVNSVFQPYAKANDHLAICFPALQSAATMVQWSGNAFARIGCDANGQNCASGDCSTNDSAHCGPSTNYCVSMFLKNGTCPSPACAKPNGVCVPKTQPNCSIYTTQVNCAAPCVWANNQCIGDCSFYATQATCLSPQCSWTNGACVPTCGPGYQGPAENYDAYCPNNGFCAPQDGSCRVGTGGVPPQTLIEFTLVNPQVGPNTDYYDVSIINGINMAVSMKPVGPIAPSCSGNLAQTSCSDTFGCAWVNNACINNPYFCGTPGGRIVPANQTFLNKCSWELNTYIPGLGDQAALLTQVQPTGSKPYALCSSSAQCASPSICGLAYSYSAGQPTMIQTCGTPVGSYYTADQICANIEINQSVFPSDALYPLPCSGARTSAMLTLLGCTAAFPSASCYSTGAANTCCGAPTYAVSSDCLNAQSELTCMSLAGCYWTAGKCQPVTSVWPNPAPGASSGVNANNDWLLYIMPWLAPLKMACPTAYTFPYDDVTSLFQCLDSVTQDGSSPAYVVKLTDPTTISSK